MSWLQRLNGMNATDAEKELLACCDSRAWAQALVRGRPYADAAALLAAADTAWWKLPPAEWLQAFAAHPRIGEAAAARPQHGAGDRWSATEQQGANTADEQTRKALADINREYDQKFGFTYIVFASGKSGEEMLQLARERMQNDPATELRVAAGEQAKIMRLRLERLLAQENEKERSA